MSDPAKLHIRTREEAFLVIEAVLDRCKTDWQSSDPKTRQKARRIVAYLAAEFAAIEREVRARGHGALLDKEYRRLRRRQNPPTKKPAQ